MSLYHPRLHFSYYTPGISDGVHYAMELTASDYGVQYTVYLWVDGRDRGLLLLGQDQDKDLQYPLQPPSIWDRRAWWSYDQGSQVLISRGFLGITALLYHRSSRLIRKGRKASFRHE